MKAAIMQGFANNSKFILKEVDRPTCGKNEVLVEIYNASVNPLDWRMHKAFSYLPVNAILPLILGRDFSGVIVEKGSRVQDFEIGDEVYGYTMNFLKGSYAEYAAVSVNQLARKPKNISFAEAAAIPLVGITALRALQNANLNAGARVLIIGASGGVGTMAVQIARSLGASVIGVCSGKNKALVESLGAEQVVDYTQQNYVDVLNGIDLVFDTTGKESLSKCQSIMNKDGNFITTLPGPMTALNLVESTLGLKQQKVKIVSAFSNRKSLETLTQMVENQQLKPVIDSEFSFEQINDSMERSKTNHARGKVILTIREQVQTKKAEQSAASKTQQVKDSPISA
ncbi:MAG TPA: NADP-dependent oxidoreductase [Pseudomonadales bacterium]|nr:NADP-dependent oxidoreductase [Pseudomonadales bacterium]